MLAGEIFQFGSFLRIEYIIDIWFLVSVSTVLANRSLRICNFEHNVEQFYSFEQFLLKSSVFKEILNKLFVVSSWLGGSSLTIQTMPVKGCHPLSRVSSHIFTWGLAQAGHLNCSRNLDKPLTKAWPLVACLFSCVAVMKPENVFPSEI